MLAMLLIATARQVAAGMRDKCAHASSALDAQIPYEYTIALAENAADNGVEIRIRRQVEGIVKSSDDGLFEIDVGEPRVLRKCS